MRDLPALLYLATTIGLVLYMAWDLDRVPPRCATPRLGRFGMNQLVNNGLLTNKEVA